MGPVLVVLVLMLAAAEVVTSCMPGDLCPVPTDDPGVLNAIRVAEEDFNDRSSDLFHTAVSKVISAETQVVWVFTYHLTLELRTTVCRKISVCRNCPFHDDPLYAKVVAGYIYYLTLQLRATVCRKGSVSRNCPFNEDPQYAKTTNCKFQVLEQSWIGPLRVIESSCFRTVK